ncbi:TetR/AcrR family transcriptional regulator [bacterium]|nr:TetR/AcrR family transcriptional regulator [bacterium]
MSRKRSISDAAILRKARSIFVEKGYTVSTQIIANSLSITQPVLFQRFESKNNLFTKSLELKGMPHWFKLLKKGPVKESYEEEIRTTIDHLYDFFEANHVSFVTLASSGLPKNEYPKEHGNFITILISELSQWFYRCGQKYKTKNINGHALALIVIGGIQSDILVSNITKKKIKTVSKESIASEITRLIFESTKNESFVPSKNNEVLQQK